MFQVVWLLTLDGICTFKATVERPAEILNMVIKFFIAAVAVLNLSGCLFKKNIEGLLTLKRLAENQKHIERSLKTQEGLFLKLAADIENNRLEPGISVENFVSSYGEPIVSKDTLSLGRRFLYRHPTNYFNSDKAYIYFDREGKLANWEYLPR